MFDTVEELLKARQPLLEGSTHTASDCLSFTIHPTLPEHFISSPNVEIVPELPPADNKIRYFEDGMMGPLEYFKWPQEYDVKAPWAVAVPGNPDILTHSRQSFFIVDSLGILPKFADARAPWFHIRSTDFIVTDAFPTGEYGRLDDAIISRLRAVVTEILPAVTDCSLKVERPEFASGACQRTDIALALESCQNLDRKSVV